MHLSALPTDQLACFAVAFAAGAFAGWFPWWMRYNIKIETVRELLAEALAEIAKIKVSVAAGLATVEAKQAYVVTKAALDVAFPDKPEEVLVD